MESGTDGARPIEGPERKTTTRGLFSWAIYDWANSAYPTLIQTFVFAAFFTRQVAHDKDSGTALWGNMLSVSALLIAVGGPILGAIADQTGRRKPWLAAFTWLCCLATAALWWVQPSPNYIWLALPLVALATLGMEFSSIFYNAMLPRLAASDRIGRWSGWGWALGYAGGLLCLIIALYGFVKPQNSFFGFDRDSAQHVRATFVLTAVWFALFSLPLLFFTPDAPSTGKKLSHAARDGIRQLWDSIGHVRRYTTIIRFLIARMIYADGLATMFAFGGVFAAGTFDMDEEKVLLFGIALNVTAGLGAAVFAWVDDWIGSKQTILISLVSLIITATLMLLARTPTLFWIFGSLLGIFVGPVQAASRSLMARMAPPELRTQMFGLYAFSGKATSFLGPLLVAWITHWSKSQRVGMSSILLLFLVGFLLMLTIPSPPVSRCQQPVHPV